MSELMNQEQQNREQGTVATAERIQQGVTFTPRVDIVETEEELTLYADLPGVTSEQLDIRFENQELTIQGKVPPRHSDVTFLYGEYGIGDFYRAFTIGESIDVEKISAELKHGVLVLHLPKLESLKPRRIEVKQA